jgi:hypothetical protein
MKLSVSLQEGWQGGPAHIALELDELEFDDGTIGPGVILEIRTPTDASGDVTTIELGTGKIEFPQGQGQLEFYVAASMAQATELRDALTQLIEA